MEGGRTSWGQIKRDLIVKGFTEYERSLDVIVKVVESHLKIWERSDNFIPVRKIW